ncbi:hypothetical protein AVEN_152188-1 [Araneus ventricosus]|uniref:Reverse transcriptase domain-containing protein n=1 Tax=Araneus ventricosus TaxID=182803 RepID=A0A4Y2HKX0_ARAVE|nr:hypothetical protein AVEN_152188-1 [Araneus ventricosus]
MINSTLVHALVKKKWLSPFFKAVFDLVDNILLLENSIREAFVSKKHLVSILFDMEKAYDKTWRYGILKDLYGIGFKGNLSIFIQNFLKTRSFRVRIGNTLSDVFYQEEAVPQDSVLSVILFTIKINDVIKQLPTGVNGSLFVDDLEIHCSREDMDFIERKLQEDVNKISEWGKKNGFQISSQKTIAIHFCRRRGLHVDLKLSSPERKSSIRCYGCGYPGFIQSKCPKCTKPKEELKTVVQSVKLYAAESPDSPSSSICLTVCGRDAAFCADTGASNSIAGEEFFKLLRDHKFRFYKRDITMVLADGKERNVEALTTTVNLNVEGKIVRVKFIALPEAKGNRTLLGTDFLQAAAIVLNIQNGTWHFSENPHKQFSFYKNPSDVKENLPTISSHKVTSPETIPVALPETSVPVIL